MTLVDVPGVFNRNDFVSILLPGYVNVVSIVVIFRPELLAFKDLSFDLFSTVLLIVAGPSLGITLRQLYRTVWLVYDEIKDRVGRKGDDDGHRTRAVPPGGTDEHQTTRDWSIEYARVRLSAKPEELAELDATEADMDFDTSTALGLLLQALAGLFLAVSPLVILGLLIVSLALSIEGLSEWYYTFNPTYKEIRLRHPPSPIG